MSELGWIGRFFSRPLAPIIARTSRRVSVAVARKLAVLLLTLWKSREPYESFHTMV